MVPKLYVILAFFLTIMFVYFVYMLKALLKAKHKKEAFEEVKETQGDILERNLFIINTFEEVHKKKISNEDLKKLVSQLDGIQSRKEMKDRIKAYRESFEEKKYDATADLKDIVEKLSSVIKKLSTTTEEPESTAAMKATAESAPKAKNVETFSDFMPFSPEKKYMPLL